MVRIQQLLHRHAERQKARTPYLELILKNLNLNIAVTAWRLTPRGSEFTLAFLEKVFK